MKGNQQRAAEHWFTAIEARRNADIYLECIESINRARAHWELMQHNRSFKTMRRIKDETRNR